ncbi:MAG: glycosyltransferase family 4 protein [Syntrophales bacterium]|nr:glycosyltransferase family 4 protein [Syntrophales bacterium]
MKPLRIAMVAACPFPANHGTPACIREMSQALAKNKNIVHVVTYPLSQEDIPVNGIHIHRVQPFWQVDQHSITVGPSKARLIYDALMIKKLCQVVSREKIDIIHAHNYEGALIGVVGKLITGRPLLYSAVNSMVDELPSYNFIRPKALAVMLARCLDFIVPRLGDAVATISNELFKYYLKQGISEKRMTVVPAGVNLEMFATGQGEQVREKYNLNGQPLVAYTGVLDRFQRLDYLFQAMRQVIAEVPEARLMIMGNLVKDITPLQQMAVELGIQSHVIFALNQPLSVLKDFLDAADVTVIPRPDTPGFPIKLLNYMAAAKATVSFQGSAKGMTHQLNGMVVPDHDVATFGQEIIKLLRNPKLRQQLGANAFQLAKANYNWDKLALIIQEIYEVLINQRSGLSHIHPMERELREKLGLPAISDTYPTTSQADFFWYDDKKEDMGVPVEKELPDSFEDTNNLVFPPQSDVREFPASERL